MKLLLILIKIVTKLDIGC